MLKLLAETVVVAPVIVKLPVIVTSPEIAPPEDEYFVLANVYAELAYEPAERAFVADVLAAKNAPLA